MVDRVCTVTVLVLRPRVGGEVCLLKDDGAAVEGMLEHWNSTSSGVLNVSRTWRRNPCKEYRCFVRVVVWLTAVT